MSEEWRSAAYAHYVSARIASAPESLSSLEGRRPYFQRLIRRYFPKDVNAAIWDLGCGHGALIHFARLAGYKNVRGVDASVEQVQTAAKLGIDGVELGNIFEALSAVDDFSCSVVISFDVVEHQTKDELNLLASLVFKKLAAGGKWIIHAPNAESPFFGRIRYGDITHEQAFTRESIAQVLLLAGFSSVACEEDAPVVHGPVSAVRLFFWWFIRNVWRFVLAAETGDSGKDSIFLRTCWQLPSNEKS